MLAQSTGSLRGEVTQTKGTKMNEQSSSRLLSKASALFASWLVIAIAASLFLLITQDQILPLFIVLIISPFLLLIFFRLELLSQRLLRDCNYIKEKITKSTLNSDRNSAETKAQGKQLHSVSKRSAQILEHLNELRQIAPFNGNVQSLANSDSLSQRQIDLVLNSLEGVNEHQDEMLHRWDNFLSEYARISHFNSISHSSLSSIQQSEISEILEEYEVNDVFLFEIDCLSTYKQRLNQTRFSSPDDLLLLLPSHNIPFVIVTEDKKLSLFSPELIKSLLSFNAAFIVTSRLKSKQLDELELSRIPTNLDLNVVELICPKGLINTDELS